MLKKYKSAFPTILIIGLILASGSLFYPRHYPDGVCEHPTGNRIEGYGFPLFVISEASGGGSPPSSWCNLDSADIGLQYPFIPLIYLLNLLFYILLVYFIYTLILLVIKKLREKRPQTSRDM